VIDAHSPQEHGKPMYNPMSTFMDIHPNSGFDSYIFSSMTHALRRKMASSPIFAIPFHRHGEEQAS
jgi:hypothetical protein